MKKIRILTIICFLTLAVLFSLLQPSQATGTPRDVSSNVNVTNWSIINHLGQEVSNTIAVYGNTLLSPGIRQGHRLEFTWSLNTGDFLQGGDFFRIPMPTNALHGEWFAIDNFPAINFNNEQGIHVGQIELRINEIIVTFNDNINGSLSVTGHFSSTSNALQVRNAVHNPSYIQNVTFGGITRPILFNYHRHDREPVENPVDFKNGVGGENPFTVRWAIFVGQRNFATLHQAQGLSYMPQPSLFIEDPLTGRFVEGSLSVLPMRIATYSFVNHSVGNLVWWGSQNQLTHFTRLQQQPGETIDQFRARIRSNSLQWGVYTTIGNVDTLFVYFGNVNTTGITYTNAWPNFANTWASSQISSGWNAESERTMMVDYFNQNFGNSNVVNGHVQSFRIIFDEIFPANMSETEITNVASINASGTIGNVTGTARITGSGDVGAVVVPSESARLSLTDIETGGALAGATFRLERFSAGTWEIVSNPFVSTNATNGAGHLYTNPLLPGTYRFVQLTSSAPYFNLAASNVGTGGVVGGMPVSNSFVIVAGGLGQSVYMTNIRSRFSVVYAPGTQGNFQNNTHNNLLPNTTTPSFSGPTAPNGDPLGNVGWTFNGWAPSVTPTVTQSIVYTAQWRINTYSVRFYHENGTTLLQSTTENHGALISPPANPTKANSATHMYIFNGWIPQGSYSLSSPVTQNMVFIASFRSYTLDTTRIILVDADSNAPLANVPFKLQELNSESGLWNDTGWSQSTNNNGFADIVSLTPGTYRFVQLDRFSNEYDLPNSAGFNTILGQVVSSEFTVTGTAIEHHQIIVTNVRYRFNVTYAPGEQGDFTNNVHLAIINTVTPQFNGPLSSLGTPRGNAGYRFTGWSPAVAGTVTQNAVYTAQWETATYTVTFYNEDGITVIQRTTEEYGAKIVPPPNPVKPPTPTHRYEFAYWLSSDEYTLEDLVTQDKEFIAVFRAIPTSAGDGNIENPPTFFGTRFGLLSLLLVVPIGLGFIFKKPNVFRYQ